MEIMKLHYQQFEVGVDVENVYKEAPRPELDVAWDRLGKREWLPS